MSRTRSTAGSLGVLAVPLLAAWGCAPAAPAVSAPVAAVAPATADAPRVFALRADALAAARARVRANDAPMKPAYDRLMDDANKALAAPLVAVTQKSLLPPSGDAHDYFSLSPYWWPDPSKPNGLPYIRRDGETNPESKRDLDQPRVATLGSRVQTLALAYYFSGDERYAARAAEQLRAWFIDPATRMNPHLRFAQLVRGIDRERGSGIIDTRPFIEAVDAAGLLRGSRAWTPADETAMRGWARSYLDWLWNSPNGIDERDAENNHGSWYAAQTASLALFTGDTALARRIVAEVPARIGAQVTPDGMQPTEMERTRSLHYSAFNLEALSRLAEMGRLLGIDVWGYQSPRGGSLRRAIDRIAPFVGDRKGWPGQQLDDVDSGLMLMQLRRGQHAYPDAGYTRLIRALPGDDAMKDRSQLLYPDR
ncbi:MAG TPA: alginate lyase family protein [Longimicrobium sp.]